MDQKTCRCGAPATCTSVDLLANLCWDCLDHFNDWADANRHALFADWPGRALVAL